MAQKPFSPPPDLKKYFWTLLPLILTQLLQRSEHVIDNRYLSELGKNAIAVHSILYNLFLCGQAIGLASATSALIFWKRKESAGAQGAVLLKHLLLTLVTTTVVSLLSFPWLSTIIHHFGIAEDYHSAAFSYLSLGLFNIILQSAYACINAMLIASDQRLLSMLYVSGILLIKALVGAYAVHFAASLSFPPILFIGFGTTLSVALFLALGFRSVVQKIDGWKIFAWNTLMRVWSSELGLALIRSLVPIGLAFQLAKVSASAGFFVTAQLSLQTAYIFVLPLIAGTQLAVRDASEAYSKGEKTNWFAYLFYTSLGPSLLLLLLGVCFGPQIFRWLYHYDIPADHRIFLPLYFTGCMVGQIGNVFLIKIRAAQRNSLATRNSLVAEFFCSLGITQILLWKGWATPLNVGLVTLTYCGLYLLLHYFSVRSIYSKATDREIL